MNLLNRFFLKVSLWIPICFAVWYFLSILLTIPLTIIVNKFMTWILPNLIEQIYQRGNHLIIITRLTSSGVGEQGAGIGEIIFELNPLIYGYSFPLYSALVLAVPVIDSKKVKAWIIGILILLFIQAFGVTANIFKELAFLNADAKAQLGLPIWSYDIIVLAYQFGYLILPSIAPIVIWIGQFQYMLVEWCLPINK